MTKPLRHSLAAVAALVLTFGVTACGSDDEPSPATTPPVSQTLSIIATEYAFSGEAAEISVGETIRFELINEGELDHELQLLSSENRVLAQIGRLSPGGTGSVVYTFDEAGTYTVICDIDDHQSRGQRAAFVVE